MAGTDPGATAQPISFQRQRFPTDAIRPAVWLYFRFTLSIRYVEELMLQRGVEVGREVIRCQVKKFSSLIASDLRRRRDPQNNSEWYAFGLYLESVVR